MTYQFVLPYPPSINHYWRYGRGHHYISQEGQNFRIMVLAAVNQSRMKAFLGAVRMRIELWPPDKRERDIDNICKSVLDAFQHAGAYANDSQIVKLTIEKFPIGKFEDTCIVELEEESAL